MTELWQKACFFYAIKNVAQGQCKEPGIDRCGFQILVLALVAERLG